MAMIRPETEMKDSGVQWLGNVPKEWSVGKVKHEFYATKTIVGDKVNDYERLALTLNGVIKRSKDAGDGLQPEKFDGYQILKEHELVFKLIDLANVSTSRVGLSPYTGIVSPAYIVLHHRKDMNPRYGEYYFLSMWMNEVFNHIGGDGVRSALNAKDLLDIPYLKVSSDEQQAIADYLDKTCSQIDEIIAEAKASIDEYKGLKQSVIFEAVTKGLDKNVEMKDSGNLAIGKIPKHWVKARVKNVATRITVGVVVTPANYFDDAGTVSFLRGINVKEYVINSEPMMYITEETNKELSKTIVHTNDLVIVRDGAIGVTAVVPEKYDGANVVSMIIVSLGSEYNHDYLCYVLNSYVGKIQFNLTKIGSALSHTSVSSVSNIEIPKPSVNEQIDIVNYLKEQHKKLNSLITEKEFLINDLEAYKKSLIYEVVTGKRRVI